MSDSLPYTTMIKNEAAARVAKIPIPEAFNTEWKAAIEWMRGEAIKEIKK